jgi:dolichyl-phosphate-mannose--protein O-mannosyl transferase
LWWILGIGFVLRLLFIGAEGFHNDVAAFESWTLTLVHNAPWQFYGKASFADYPPGYFVVLWLIGHLYPILPGAANDGGHGWSTLRDVVKLPAIVMDLVDAGLVYAIARRYAAPGIALFAAALLAFNPAAIYVSAYWGQVDSISWGLVLLALWLVLRAGDEPGKTIPRLTWAWLAFAFSLLIKPQAATIGFLFLAYPFATTDAATRARRLAGTGCGIVAALVLAWAVGGLFDGTPNPVAVFGWLWGRYTFASNVYPYTSVNAFNLYAIHYPFWQSDAQPLTFFGVRTAPLSVWGIALVAASTLLVVGRYLQRRDDRALLEGALLCALAFFVLATRMHERYVYGAFLLAMPLVAFGRVGLASAVTLSVTMFLNLAYSFAYQFAVERHTPGVDPTNLWPAISHPTAIANAALFFWLGYRYLGNAIETQPASAGLGEELRAAAGALATRARGWFDPREGIAAMTRVDWLIAAGFTVASFVLCLLWVQYPAERYFDEVYYPRAGEEYLKHLDVSGWGPFEFTHPPFTKLLITASMLLFGGLHGLGDTGIGWRFLNVVVGALTVGLLYAFAKRLTSSTLFASFAAFMLLFDGFHFVQSRIATPEITVAFFALLTLYALYRLWIGTQIVVRPIPPAGRARAALAITMGIGAIVAAALGFATPYMGPHDLAGRDWAPSIVWSGVVMAFYVLMLFWLVGRLVVVPRVGARARETAYADGTRVIAEGAQLRALTPEREIALGAGKRATLDDEGELRRTLESDGTLEYATPVARATYRADGTAEADGGRLRAADARVWWIVLALACAFVVDSKWSGLFDVGIVCIVAALIAAQRRLHRPALFGNPFGVPLDLLASSIVVVVGVVYLLSYIPYFTQGHGFDDVVAMQHAMYRYHSTLVATHPYASQWWQWPLLLKPISYFWVDHRANPADPAACCVAEILALPNPFTWWFGIATVPIVGWLAWCERNKGYALLAIAYVLQWLPWVHSPRLMFEYHFYPNDAIIMLANAVVLQRVWHWRPAGNVKALWPRYAVGAYALIVLGAFVYFYPVLAAVHVPWNAWHARMWLQHWII